MVQMEKLVPLSCIWIYLFQWFKVRERSVQHTGTVVDVSFVFYNGTFLVIHEVDVKHIQVDILKLRTALQARTWAPGDVVSINWLLSTRYVS